MRPETYSHADTFPASCATDIRAIYAYWDARRGDRACPARADLDPVDIPRLLPGIILADVISTDPLDLFYRLVGTREVDYRGRDPTGKTVREAFHGCTLEDALCCYHAVIDTRAPLYRANEYVTRDNILVQEERLFLPLSDNGETVNRILVFITDRPVPKDAPAR